MNNVLKKNKVCPEGQILSIATNRCIKIKPQKVPKVKEPKTCPEGQTLNIATNRCIKIKPQKVPKVKEPKTCPEGQTLNIATNRCIKIKPQKEPKEPKVKEPKVPKVKEPKVPKVKEPKICPEGQTLNIATNRCIKIKPQKVPKEPTSLKDDIGEKSKIKHEESDIALKVMPEEDSDEFFSLKSNGKPEEDLAEFFSSISSVSSSKSKSKVKDVKKSNNMIIIENLKVLMDYERLYKNPFKANAYNKVINNIKFLGRDIKTLADLDDVKGVGPSIYIKIKQILKTGKFENIEKILHDDKYILSKKITDIYGIGPVKAKELIEKLNKFEDLYLDVNKKLLNEKQQIGLKYYDELKLRIPYEEGKKHHKIISDCMKELYPNDKITFEMVGSYRRKNKDMGDIDILIKDNPVFSLNEFVNKLQEKKYLIENLAHGKKKYMGISKLSSDATAVRIDILVADVKTYYFALLYFTGSYIFNIEMRNIALEKGLSLSEYGFKDNDTKQLIDTSDIIKSEEDIFKYLDMAYVKPEKR